jgi:hypothetical protein
MKTLAELLLALLLATAAHAHSEEYPAAVVGYGEELKAPFEWVGIDTEQLSIVDANKVILPFYPTRRVALREIKSPSQDRYEVLCQRHLIHNEAAAVYKASGFNAMILVYQTKDLVSHLTDLGNKEYIIHYLDGDEEFLTEYGDSSGGASRTQEDVHNLLIKKFSNERARGESIWFGSDGYYIHYKATAKDLDLYRAAVSNLKASRVLTEEESNTPAGDNRIQRDIGK